MHWRLLLQTMPLHSARDFGQYCRSEPRPPFGKIWSFAHTHVPRLFFSAGETCRRHGSPPLGRVSGAP
eukprot:1533899-Pyramimonas_sp.AAC.1